MEYPKKLYSNHLHAFRELYPFLDFSNSENAKRDHPDLFENAIKRYRTEFSLWRTSCRLWEQEYPQAARDRKNKLNEASRRRREEAQRYIQANVRVRVRGIRQLEREQEERRLVIQQMPQILYTPHRGIPRPSQADEAGDTLANEDACLVCQERTKRCVSLPCGHVSMCIQCSRASLQHSTTCSECRVQLTEIKRLYF